MPERGFFITLKEEDKSSPTLHLYLARGVYSTHMPPIPGQVPQHSKHYPTLADYCCSRGGAHVFFFLKRKIVYGGQVVGADDIGAFSLNGIGSPMGRMNDSPLVWDESGRTIYSRYSGADSIPGAFTIAKDDKARNEVKVVCQPFLLRFEDKLGLKGHCIDSDEFYFEMGVYPYPLPASSISGMSFCTLTPGETQAAIRLMKETSHEPFDAKTEEPVDIRGTPMQFTRNMGVDSLSEVKSEFHMEAMLLANPDLFPKELRPQKATICRQVPICPFKPAQKIQQMDRADICYYGESGINEGTLPDTIIELKKDRAGKAGVRQVVRYAKWLERLASRGYVPQVDEIRIVLMAPSFVRDAAGYIPKDLKVSIELFSYEDGSLQTRL